MDFSGKYLYPLFLICFFKGIGLEESQFMDQSNSNIKNVFGQEQLNVKPPQQNIISDDQQIPNQNLILSQNIQQKSDLQNPFQNVGQQEQQPASQMIGLQDLNLGEMGLDDMSRISMGMADQQMNNDFKKEEIQAPQPLQSDKVPAQIIPEQVVLTQPQPAVQQTEWKKFTFQKKKKFAGKKDQSSIQKSQNTVVQDKSSISVNQQSKIEVAKTEDKPKPKNLYTSNLKRQEQQKNKNQGRFSPDSPEPLPLFDCIFCVGIHEHLVTQTVKERNLKNKYGEPNDRDYGKNVNQTQIQDEHDQFYQECQDLQKLFVINLLEYKNVEYIESNEDTQSNQDDFDFQIPQTQQSLQNLKDIVCGGQQTYKPMENTILNLKSQIQKKKQEQKVQKKAITPAQRSMSSKNSDYEEDMNLVSNILDNFDDIDPQEQSMFMNLNIRNRRQKILHKLSFETEAFDIYDPIYTSEEESNSNTDSSSSGSSGSSIEESPSSYGSQTTSSQQDEKSSSEENQRVQDYENKNQLQIDSEQIQQNSIQLDQDFQRKAQGDNKKSDSQLNEQDLDYNSEYNRSSLSSIHREIHEPSEKLVSGESKSQQISERKNTNLTGLVDEGEELGGCLVEDMQDDTVMNKCKSMFKQDNGQNQGESSFQAQIMQQRQAQITHQLNNLDQNYIVLESINADDSKINESRNQAENQLSKSPNKRATGRFKNYLVTSEKKEKAYEIEDDSIIRILPGLPSGLQGGNTAVEVLEEVDLKEQSNSAIGGQLSPVIKVKRSQKQKYEKVQDEEIQIKLQKINSIIPTDQIQIQDLEQGNPMQVPQKVNIMTDESSSANLSDLNDKFKQQSQTNSQNHMVSCQPNQLQIVDSGSEISVDELMTGHQVDGNKSTQEDQLVNLSIQPIKSIPVSKQKSTGQRKRPKPYVQQVAYEHTQPQQIDFYNQMGKIDTVDYRKASNCSNLSIQSGSLKNSGIQQQIQKTSYAQGTVSMGTLPTLKSFQNHGLKRIGSSKYLPEQDADEIEMINEPVTNNFFDNKGTRNQDVETIQSNSLPSKTEVSQDTTSKNQQTTKKSHKTRIQYISKPTQPQKQQQQQTTAKKEKKQTMLSRDQLKLMKQLEKQQKKPQIGSTAAPKKRVQMTQDANVNRKNAIDNYFKLGGLTIDQNNAGTIDEEKYGFDEIEDLAFIKKRSVTNMNVREKSKETKGRERSLNQRTIGHYRNEKQESNPQKSKNLRSSSIEMNIYNQTQAIQMAQGSQKQKDAKIKQYRKSSTGSTQKQAASKIPNLDLKKLDKISPEIINKVDAVSQRKQLNKIQQHIQNESQKNLQYTKYQSQIQSMPDTKRMLPQSIQKKEIKQNQKSILHSSTSQLEQFSLSALGMDSKEFQNKNKQLALSKITDVVQIDETDIMMPAHSHRGFSKQKLLSISADKNAAGPAKELMKSTMNMQQNLSQIQSKNLQNQTNNNQISKASIERDIKYLKINTDQTVRKPTKSLMQLVSNQKNRRKNVNIFQEDEALGTIGEVVLKPKEEPKKKLGIQTQTKRSKDSTAINQPTSTKNKTKKPHHSQKTSMALLVNMNDRQNTGSTASIKMVENSEVLSPQKQSSKNSFSSNQKRGGQLSQVHENYKKLILENAKILQFNSNLISSQTPQENHLQNPQIQDQFSQKTTLNKFKSTNSKTQSSQGTQKISSQDVNFTQSNNNSQYANPLYKTKSNKEKQHSSQPTDMQPVLKKFQSTQYPQKAVQRQIGDQLSNFSSLPMQIQKAEAVQNPQMYYASQVNPQFTQQQQAKVSLNLAQMQGGAKQMQPNTSNNQNEIKLKPQKSSGSNGQQSVSHLTGLQHGSMGVTTFLKSNGNVNTTASSNTMMIGNKSQFGQKSLLNFQNTNMMQMTNSNINVTSNSQFDNTQKPTKISDLLQKTQKINKGREEKELDKSAPTAKKLYQKHHSQYEDNFDL